MKYTEGPWKTMYLQEKSGVSLAVVPAGTLDGETVTAICVVTPWQLENATDRANAALISKAPELLKVLEELLDVAEEDQKTGVEEGVYENKPREDIIRLKKLLAEAKGEQL